MNKKFILITVLCIVTILVTGLFYAYATEDSQNAVYQMGDVNKDGLVNTDDAQEILAIYAENQTNGDGEDTYIKYGDLDKDGIVDATDASFLLKYIAVKTADASGEYGFEDFESEYINK